MPPEKSQIEMFEDDLNSSILGNFEMEEEEGDESEESEEEE